MLFHKAGQELDGKEGNGESDCRADGKIADFRAGHRAAFHKEFQQLLAACADHRRDSEEESEFGCRNAGHTKQ